MNRYVFFAAWAEIRKMSLTMISEVAVETALPTAIVMLCVGTTTLFGWLMSVYGILEVAGSLFETYASSPTVFLLFATVLFLLLGAFMDPAPAMLIFVPVLAGVAGTVGADPL